MSNTIYDRYVWTKPVVLGFQFGVLASAFFLLDTTLNGLKSFRSIPLDTHITTLSASVLNGLGEYLSSSTNSEVHGKRWLSYICAVCAFLGNATGVAAPFAAFFIPFIHKAGAVVLVVTLELALSGFISAVFGKTGIKATINTVVIVGWIMISLALCIS